MHAIRSQDRSYLWLMTEMLLLISFFLVCVAVTGEQPLCDNSSCTCIICTLFCKCYTSTKKLTNNIPVELGAALMLLTTELPASLLPCYRGRTEPVGTEKSHSLSASAPLPPRSLPRLPSHPKPDAAPTSSEPTKLFSQV